MGGKRAPWLRGAILVGGLCAALAAAPASSPGSAQPLRYVALGDSFSSGEGDPPYLPASNQLLPHDLCHRSNSAYPSLIHGRRGGPWSFWACSGARIRDLTHRNAENPTEPAQLDRVAPAGKSDTHVGLVTLTIGGNDAQFTIAFRCSASRLVLPLLLCPANWRASVTAGVRRVRSTLPGVLRALRARAPNARILLLGYPDPLPAALPADTRCSLWFSAGDVAWVTKEAAAVNGVLSSAAAASGARITYVPPTGFAGHDACSQRSWFNAFELDPSKISGSFHPNPLGQRQLAREVLAHI